MNPIAVTTYKQLQEEISNLPVPADGTVRVFRGQSEDYGVILSSFGRLWKTRPKSEVFDAFMRHLHIKSGLLDLLGDLLKLPRLSAVDFRISGADFYMAESLVQHYGYQTRYIDVTSSVDIALWFALHRFQGQIDTRVGETAPFRLTFPAWYTSVTEPGVLYVFDTKPWNQVSSVAEGEYIDLVSIVPEGVNRPRRQAGGVLYALGWSPGNGDLSGLVRAKFEVRFPWEEVGQHWETDYLFPGPAEDPIYSSLLQAPFFRTVEKRADGSEGVVYRRSCTLPEYCRGPEDAQRQASYRSYDHRLKPTLYYPWLRQNLEQLQANPNWLPNFRPAFEQSIPIMLQRPHILFSMHRRGPAPPPEAPPSTVPHPFQNFFLEYSPEDLAIAYDENRKARGFWCFFFPDEFLLQSFGTAKGEPYAEDYHIYQWQPGRGLVQTEGPDKMGSYVTEPLDLIRMTVEGLLRLDPPGNLGHGYYELTTTEQFWSALPTWTDLM